MSAFPQRPIRRWSAAIKVGGDTREDMIRCVEEILESLRGGSNGPIIHGGQSSGFTAFIVENPAMTHERYAAENEAWIKAGR